MVVRVEMLVLASAVAKQFERAVRDDLVGVHVRRSAGATLDHVHGKVLMQLARDDFVASGSDGFRALRIEHAEFGVRGCRSFLHESERADEVLKVAQRDAGEREVFHAAQGLHAVVRGVGQLAFAEEVVLPAPSRDDWCRAAAELLTSRAQPRTETPSNVANHAVKELRFRSPDFFENRPRNLPNAHCAQRDG